MKKRVTVKASRVVDERLEAARVLGQLKSAYDAVESCSNEVYQKYVPENLLDDLGLAIREMHMALGEEGTLR